MSNNPTKFLAVALALPMLAITNVAKAAEAVEAGTGKVKLNTYLKGNMLNDTTATGDRKLNFNLNNAEFKFSGSVVEATRWWFAVDPAKRVPGITTTVSGTTATSSINTTTADNRILQELAFGFSLVDNLELIFGQVKPPTTAEWLDPAAEIWFIDRSMAARTQAYRSTGAQVVYKDKMFKAAAMVYNGQVTNTDDTNNPKDLSVRLEVTPMPMINVGAFTTAADFKYSTKSVWGVNTKLVPMEDLGIKGEFVAQKTQTQSLNGYAMDIGYTYGQWLPVFRYEGQSNGTIWGTAATFGLNYLVSKYNSRIQATYGLLNDVTAGTGAYSVSAGKDGTVFTLAFQSAI